MEMSMRYAHLAPDSGKEAINKAKPTKNITKKEL